MRITNANALRDSVAICLIARFHDRSEIMRVLREFNADEWLGLTSNEIANELSIIIHDHTRNSIEVSP